MSFDLSWWASHLVSLVLGALVSGLFFLLQAKIDFKALSAEISALSVLVQQFVPFLKIKVEEREVISNASPIERKIFLGLIDDDYKERRSRFADRREVSVPDFERGWRLLFEETLSGKQGTLRDLTFSSHGDAAFQRYDFTSYPALVREYIERFDGRFRKARFMIVCGENRDKGENNKRAEKFLVALLEIKYPTCSMREAMFKLWNEDDPGDRHNVHVMITTESILRRVVGPAAEVAVDCPFNVYDEAALSRSVVRSSSASKPLPRLEISTEASMVSRYARIFDLVWDESVNFKKRVVEEMTEEQVRALGSGSQFDHWSRSKA